MNEKKPLLQDAKIPEVLIREYLLANREVMADVCHEIWAHWMKYVFNNCGNFSDFSTFEFLINGEHVDRWVRQISTPYSELTEKEKDSDREQADKIINALLSND